MRKEDDEDDDQMIRTTKSVPKSLASFYFEIKILDRGDGGVIGIGLTQADPETRSGAFPGWPHPTLGIGYHGDDGGIYHDSSRPKFDGELYSTNDVIGCFMCRFRDGEEDVTMVQFTKNEKKVLSPKIIPNAEWHPTIGIASDGASIDTNFGNNKFTFNPKGKFVVSL